MAVLEYQHMVVVERVVVVVVTPKKRNRGSRVLKQNWFELDFFNIQNHKISRLGERCETCQSQADLEWFLPRLTVVSLLASCFQVDLIRESRPDRAATN